MFCLKEATAVDAESLLKCWQQLDSESDYLLYEIHERVSLEQVIKYLVDARHQVFLAENKTGEIIGYISSEAKHLQRLAHNCRINIGVRKSYRKQKIAETLCEMMLTAIKKNTDIKRIEVSIIAENKASLFLCKKFGFQEEGRKLNAIQISGAFFDEIILAKFI